MCNVLPLWLCSAHGCALSVTFLLKVSYFIKKRWWHENQSDGTISFEGELFY